MSRVIKFAWGISRNVAGTLYLVVDGGTPVVRGTGASGVVVGINLSNISSKYNYLSDGECCK